MNIQGLTRAARTHLPILVLEGGYVCLLEELSWNSDARRKGEAADATPDLRSSKLSCPRQDCPGATVTGLLKPERSSSGVGAATGSRGQLEALTRVPLLLIKAQNRNSCRVGDSESTRKGSSNGRAGPCYTHPAYAP